MNTTTQNTVPDYSGNFSDTTTTGAGRGLATGLSPAKPNTTGAGAGVLLGIEAMTVADALGGRELAAGALLAACQQQQDARIVERSAYKLRARMQGDGKAIEDCAFSAAVQDAFCAVTMWRAGVTTTRTDDGADTMTSAGAGDLEKHVARVAWRALVASLSADSVGVTLQIFGGAEDDWLCAQMLPSESRTERAARLWIERNAGNRQALLVRRMSHVSGGRGRRAQAIEKVSNALGLMLGGDSLDTAALAVGFKVRGRHAAGDGLIRAATRLGLIGDGFTIPRRGR